MLLLQSESVWALRFFFSMRSGEVLKGLFRREKQGKGKENDVKTRY